MKRVPKHIKRKCERMNKLMNKVADLNTELVEWPERNGVEDSQGLIDDYRLEKAYGTGSKLKWFMLEWFYDAVEEAIN